MIRKVSCRFGMSKSPRSKVVVCKLPEKAPFRKVEMVQTTGEKIRASCVSRLKRMGSLMRKYERDIRARLAHATTRGRFTSREAAVGIAR